MPDFLLIDSHAHIQGAEFSHDLDEVIRRAKEAGVENIIVVGGAGDLSTNDTALELAQSYPGLYATVGMHPHDAKEVSEEALQKLEALAKSPKVVAVGETGLDFYYNHSPRHVQIELFCRFIQMARQTRLPLVVHNREAQREVVEFLRREGKGDLQGVVHCFTGDYEAAREILELGFYLSFTGIITFKNADSLRDVVRKLPLHRILIETDSPYLTPVPHRGKRNEPAFVRFVAEALSEIKGLSLDEVAEATSRNAKALFGF
ncbi:MAG: TatD family hydrolase [Deltaproteobacteria bacterium]|nr:TatD family hydrolase [Deltaproteobacteria bacterium]